MTAMLCPKTCGGTLALDSEGARCTRCGFALAPRDGVLDFVGGARETRLDVAAYDKAVGDPAQQTRMFDQLVDVLAKSGKTQIPVTVELGTGTGAWTVGIDRAPQFEELYAVDVSFAFLSLLKKRLSNPRTHLVCQSAEALEFEPGSVDLVAGRSFLHHILDYEALLAKCARWLKPGGIAVFFEPCMQGKIWVAFFAEAIRRLDANLPGERSLSDRQSKILVQTMRHILKEHYNKDLDKLRPIAEDKWIFDLDALRETARKVGFSNVTALDNGGPDRLMAAVKTALISALQDNAAVKRYHSLFESFTATVVLGLPQILTSPMVFFVFAK
jgi:ubiquinone/menaquinone biosynthesis C-methylase UbiE